MSAAKHTPGPFALVAVGDEIAAMFGGRSHVRVVGRVERATAARFEVVFPAAPAALDRPCRMTFRRSDGRSVGTRCFKFAAIAKATGGAA